MNIWQDLAHEIMQIPVDDPLRGRKIQAMVKRFVHEAKGSIYQRTHAYLKYNLSRHQKYDLRKKYQMHRRMSLLPDDEVLTWEG